MVFRVGGVSKEVFYVHLAHFSCFFVDFLVRLAGHLEQLSVGNRDFGGSILAGDVRFGDFEHEIRGFAESTAIAGFTWNFGGFQH